MGDMVTDRSRIFATTGHSLHVSDINFYKLLAEGTRFSPHKLSPRLNATSNHIVVSLEQRVSAKVTRVTLDRDNGTGETLSCTVCAFFFGYEC